VSEGDLGTVTWAPTSAVAHQAEERGLDSRHPVPAPGPADRGVPRADAGSRARHRTSRVRIDHRVGLLALAGPLDRRTIHLAHDVVAVLLLGDHAGVRAFDGAYGGCCPHGRARS
jgi:hypothetical protein